MAVGNRYFECRKMAAEYNESLKSRERAAEILGVSPESLRNYELGITKVVPNDVVMLMADLYNAPQLVNEYCRDCPMSAYHQIASEVAPIDRITIKLLRDLETEKIESVKRVLLDISDDGRITDGEAEQLKDVVEQLNKIALTISQLNLIQRMA